MRHQLTERNVLVKRVVRLKIGQVLLDGSIQVEFTALNKLHDADIREELGNGADAVDRFWTGGYFFVRIGVGKSLCPNNLLIVGQGDRKSKEILGLILMLDEFRECDANRITVFGS